MTKKPYNRIVDGLKKCNKCEIIKPIEQFGKTYRSKCIQCCYELRLIKSNIEGKKKSVKKRVTYTKRNNKFTFEEAKAWNFKNLKPTNYKEYKQMYRDGKLPVRMCSIGHYQKHIEYTSLSNFIPVREKRFTLDEFKDWVLKNLYPAVKDSNTWDKYTKGQYPELPNIPEQVVLKPHKHYPGFKWGYVFGN
ncbi:hypothetical protein SAMN04515674_105338 [Pseudarcicella hirudinis]|uniref:Uncharacterized protein n=1 Tax=Pseudarcicella hirudinis TaxID=1079859 RepID=A0A1I5T2J7_9BACT|nr:hypothetical protein [Pseudarcicella hirudinis]SFP77188.1 hypothetical protein SAMN04515674_105338 [Pseudarcicella hirudinis]